jgi:hypothetical protein
MTNHNKTAYTTDQIADMLDLHRSTVYNALEAAHIQPVVTLSKTAHGRPVRLYGDKEIAKLKAFRKIQQAELRRSRAEHLKNVRPPMMQPRQKLDPRQLVIVDGVSALANPEVEVVLKTYMEIPEGKRSRTLEILKGLMRLPETDAETLLSMIGMPETSSAA